jgi:hypothetical protein
LIGTKIERKKIKKKGIFRENLKEGGPMWKRAKGQITIRSTKRVLMNLTNRKVRDIKQIRWEVKGILRCRCFRPATYQGEYPR